MYYFHINVFGNPFHCTWEDVAARLESLDRMIFEPDGSWIWSGEVIGDSELGNQWHINGHLFDFSGTLHRVELHGWCPADQFDRLLTCLGWPQVTLTFEMVREGLQLSEADFRAAMISA
jgi:hypothetical protein